MLLGERVPYLAQPAGVEVVVFGLPGLLGQHCQRAAVQPHPELPLDLRASLGDLARARGEHLTERLGYALHLEVAGAVAGPGADSPAGLHERVSDLRAEQRAALQGGVVAKPFPRVGRHQLPIGARDADHKVVDVELRGWRAITPRPPRRHVQRRGDRRPGGRLADSRAVLAAAVNDRLVARHVLHGPLRRLEQRVLNQSSVPVIGHRPQDRYGLRHRQRHLHVRDTVDLLDHRSPLLVEQRLAVLVARLALERPRPAELLRGVHVLALQHRDQVVPLDRLTAPHPEPRQRILRT